jgi:outer membrane protein assembly factor BamB
MMSVSRTHGGWFGWSGVLVCLVGAVGCRPPVESTPQAVALPLVEQDPMEDGVGVDAWPGWRGRNGSGIAPGGRTATSFSATEGFRWKVEVPGRGHSSPVVWDDSVLLTTAIADTDPPTLAILCFQRSDGRLAWQADVGTASGPTHKKNGLASATVATDGERIFAFFGTTGLFCYDFSGERLWGAYLGDLTHMWGTAASPMLYGDLVIQVCDSKEDSYIAAFDAGSGDRVWRTSRASYGCWSTPVVVEAEVDGARRMELVVNGTGSDSDEGRLITAYDPEDGRQLWQVWGATQWVTPTPMVSGGLVYCTCGRNGPIFAIRPGGSGDVTESRVVWKARRGGPYIPSGLAYRNRLYLVRDNRDVTCYNAGDGQQIWTGRLGGTFTSSLVVAEGRIYATNERGTVYVFAAADSFELLAKNDMRERCLATPAIAGGELFIRTEGHLYCIAEEEP